MVCGLKLAGHTWLNVKKQDDIKQIYNIQNTNYYKILSTKYKTENIIIINMFKYH